MMVLVLSVLTAGLAAIVPMYFGCRKPGYSHIRHTISELAEAGSPVGRSVALYGFLPIGLLTWLSLWVAAQAAPHVSRETFFMLSLIGSGYVGGALFRSDPNAPMFGSLQNTLHNIFGSLEYAGAAGAFLSLERDAFWAPLSSVAKYAGFLILICFC
ncbi:MAG TPA: DUF998 domain-containing protein, partial [Bryobacteraceae bacterium]|nr:DUF998 domain-containing protein [Bryobacteraceae bacterium]